MTDPEIIEAIRDGLAAHALKVADYCGLAEVTADLKVIGVPLHSVTFDLHTGHTVITLTDTRTVRACCTPWFELKLESEDIWIDP